MSIKEIHNICLKYKIKNYTINDDLSIDVDGNVYLSNRRLRELPLNFRNVTGYFDCSHNYLTKLDGLPSKVDEDFYCDHNKLTTLEGAPSYVGGVFWCFDNPLESLKGITLNLSPDNLFLPDHFTYSDYLKYCKVGERDLKFKKILK